MNDPRGSLWRKWDLHLHTPSSPDYANKSVSNDEIIDTLFKNGIAAAAITDHHLIDLARIRELQELYRCDRKGERAPDRHFFRKRQY